ncbi:MAG: hypothetical protein ACOY3K_02845 [Candidatus Omnitrophota bacterium]
MNPQESEALKKKMTELEKRLNISSHLILSYLNALILLLADKGIASREEFAEYLERSKAELRKLGQEAEFLKMMKDFKKDGKNDQGSL